MGTFRYPVILWSRDRRRSTRVEALVDTGATYTWVPTATVEARDYRPLFRQPLRMANGQVIERDATEVTVEIDGAQRTTIVIMGDTGS